MTRGPELGQGSHTETRSRIVRTIVLTALALNAFAANSVLCRMALREGAIDAASFSAVRLASGALVLMSILALRRAREVRPSRGSWRAAAMLYLYAVPFSYAYVSLETGTGALILFGAVQITMVSASLIAGHRPTPGEWAGVLVAFGGFVYLNLPGLSAPPLSGFLLMSLAGIAWGIYTLAGRGSSDPLGDTGYNFLRSLPPLLLLLPLLYVSAAWSAKGILLAALSGGVASGVGYTIWYAALRTLTTTQAAVLQLLVPVIAAAGGVLLVGEPITLRLVIAAALILGGILLVIFARARSLPR